MIPLLLLKRWREITIAALAVALIIQRHSNNRLAYEHPQVKEVVRTVRVEGPVRIRTVVVEKPSGEKQTTTEETREPVVETNDTARESTPILAGRTDRWLVTLGSDRLKLDGAGKMAMVGYGFGNRVDVQAGIVNTEGAGLWKGVSVTLRF
jgi:hypothetical protein